MNSAEVFDWAFLVLVLRCLPCLANVAYATWGLLGVEDKSAAIFCSGIVEALGTR